MNLLFAQALQYLDRAYTPGLLRLVLNRFPWLPLVAVAVVGMRAIARVVAAG
jgi:hypothetical protein